MQGSEQLFRDDPSLYEQCRAIAARLSRRYRTDRQDADDLAHEAHAKLGLRLFEDSDHYRAAFHETADKVQKNQVRKLIRRRFDRLLASPDLLPARHAPDPIRVLRLLALARRRIREAVLGVSKSAGGRKALSRLLRDDLTIDEVGDGDRQALVAATGLPLDKLQTVIQESRAVALMLRELFNEGRTSNDEIRKRCHLTLYRVKEIRKALKKAWREITEMLE